VGNLPGANAGDISRENIPLFEILSPDNAPIFLASLSNVPGGRVHHEFVRSEDELQKFIGNYNHPGRALYRTVAQLREPDEEWERNKWRCKNNVTDDRPPLGGPSGMLV
jgi:hypothetical protein